MRYAVFMTLSFYDTESFNVEPPAKIGSSRRLIASSATEVLACGSTLNDRRRGRAEQYWQNARAIFSTGRYSFVVTATGAAVFRSVLSRANA